MSRDIDFRPITKDHLSCSVCGCAVDDVIVHASWHNEQDLLAREWRRGYLTAFEELAALTQDDADGPPLTPTERRGVLKVQQAAVRRVTGVSLL